MRCSVAILAIFGCILISTSVAVSKGRIEVKAFIYEDVKLFHNVEFKPIPGHNPDLVLLDDNDEEIERIDLSTLSREECNKLLRKRGFYQKQTEEEEVPVEYVTGPYVEREDL